MKTRMLPLLVLVVSLTIPSWAAERQGVQLLVPADKLARRALSRAPCRIPLRPSRRGRRSMTARVPASGVMGKMGMVMGLWPSG